MTLFCQMTLIVMRFCECPVDRLLSLIVVWARPALDAFMLYGVLYVWFHVWCLLLDIDFNFIYRSIHGVWYQFLHLVFLCHVSEPLRSVVEVIQVCESRISVLTASDQNILDDSENGLQTYSSKLRSL